MRLPLQSQSLNPWPSVQSLQSKAFSCNPLVVTLCLPSQALSHNYSVPNFQLQPLTRSLKRSVGTLLSQPFSHNHSVRLVFSLLSPISLQYQAFNLKPSTATFSYDPLVATFCLCLHSQAFSHKLLVATFRIQSQALSCNPSVSSPQFQAFCQTSCLHLKAPVPTLSLRPSVSGF